MQGLICEAHGDRDVYMELISRFPLRPIRSEKELTAAASVLDDLLDCEQMSADAEDYMIVLEGLIATYEKEHHSVPPVPDRELLRHLMDARGVTQRDVAIATGIVYSTVSAVLTGKRELTREHIGRLCKYFHVSPDTFSFGDE